MVNYEMFNLYPTPVLDAAEIQIGLYTGDVMVRMD